MPLPCSEHLRPQRHRLPSRQAPEFGHSLRLAMSYAQVHDDEIPIGSHASLSTCPAHF